MSKLNAPQTLTGAYDDATSSFRTQMLNNFVPSVYDSFTLTATSSTVATYKYYTGGTSGTLVGTITLTYVDSSQTSLVSAVRT